MSSNRQKWAPGRRLGVVVESLLLGVFILCFVQPLAAQYRGTIRGVVTDPSGAAVPGAKVTLENTATTVTVVQNSNAEGLYLFNLVQPGSYTVTVEKAGFQKFVQSQVSVMTTSDVTVNALLKIGNVAQTVTVIGETGAHVEFNTSSLKMVVQGTNLANLPVLARNPFTLALLDAGVVNQYWDISHRLPFYMWSDNGMDIGGPTSYQNQLLLDGTMLNIAGKASYNAPMDAVNQVAVMENTPDAKYGFSAGGTINLSMKTGTNQYHGDIYYFGRQPNLNALANRITRDPNVVKQDIAGGTFGNPIIKNKLFNFFAYEQWWATEPSSVQQTLPTADERNGDFSGALTPQGTQRVIYNPFTTVLDPNTGAVTRTPFAGNMIPAAMQDPTAQKLMTYMWAPNNPGTDLSGANNFQKVYPWWTHYWNLSDRVDYNVSDKFRMFARFSKFQTRLDNVNWGGTIAVPSDNGGTMDALNAVIDGVWMINPTTALDVNVGVVYFEDTYDSQWAKVDPSVWAGLWPNSNWYTNVISSASGIGIYFPRFTWTGNGGGPHTGIGGWWFNQGRAYDPTVNLTKETGKHSLEFGWEWRHQYWQNPIITGPGSTSFNSIDTGNTFQSSYLPSQSGDMWASTLLGVVNSGNAQTPLLIDMHFEQVALYAQDNFHLNNRITLNMGLRWERHTGPREEQYQLTKTLDLTQQIPQLQSLTIPQIGNIPPIAYKFNGAMLYTSAQDPRMYDAPWNLFLPRIGIAIRINDKTSLRAGYARFAVPWETHMGDGTVGLQANGFAQNTDALGPLSGSPQTALSDPYATTGSMPTSAWTYDTSPNPVQLPAGNSLGRYTDLGNSITFWNGNQMKTPINDRFNLGFQHQAPFRLFTQATFYMAFEHNAQPFNSVNTYNANQMDPNLAYTYKGLVDSQVANPFYNLLPANEMPGSLRLQQTVSASQLLRLYPQYGTLTQRGWPGFRDHYYSLAFQANRPMSHGLTLVIAYNYARQTLSQYFNDVSTYNNDLQLLDARQPRNNLRFGGTYQLPFGQGKQFANHVNKLVDAVIGGWGTSQLLFWRSGNLLSFGSAMVNGDPTQNIPAGYYFNPAAFQALPAYVERTNPLYYEGIRGPNWWELDSSFFKTFNITEGVKFELRMELYNMPNVFMPSDPDVGVGSGTMGKSTWVAGGNYGREAQFMGRIIF
jgi:Carboxypeptidase regulatory-like domain